MSFPLVVYDSQFDSDVLVLLKRVHHYYPIGLPSLNDSYPGYTELTNILEKKIATLQKEEKIEPWATLVEKVSVRIGHTFVMDMSYLQFPNYKLIIELEKDEKDEQTTIKSIVLVISLLADYYTIYFDHQIRYTRFREKGNVHSSNILFSEINGTGKEKEIVKICKELTTQTFPTKKFIYHKALFDFRLSGGIPHGDLQIEDTDKRTIYRYLFDFFDFPNKKEVFD